jgi:hypothetical protein
MQKTTKLILLKAIAHKENRIAGTQLDTLLGKKRKMKLSKVWRTKSVEREMKWRNE